MDASLHIEVSEHLSVVEGHGLAESVRHELFQRFAKLDEVTVHVDPEGEERHHQKTTEHETSRR